MYNAHIVTDNSHEIVGWETGLAIEGNYNVITTLCLVRAIKVGHVWYGLETVQTMAPGLEDDDWDRGDGLALSLNDTAPVIVSERLGDYENALAYVKGDLHTPAVDNDGTKDPIMVVSN